MYKHCGFNSHVSPLHHSKKYAADLDRTKNKEQNNYENNVNNSGNYNAKRKLQRKGDATKSKETAKRSRNYNAKCNINPYKRKKKTTKRRILHWKPKNMNINIKYKEAEKLTTKMN